MNQESRSFGNLGRRAAAVSALVFLALTAFAAAAPARAAAPAAFSNVQVFAQTSSGLAYTYAFSAYNDSGYLVGSYQTPFPAASFELPNGQYLITVSAMYQVYSPCYLCLSPQTYSGQTAVGGSASSPVYRSYQPSAEYGFVSKSVNGPDTITIATQNVSQIQTVPVTVKVTYANGTAAADASVSASVVGQWYYWWGSDNTIVMWGQTDANGVVKLVLPSAPVEITAWDWVPVNLPQSQTTVQRNVGGETINVTVYWQPTYVGLAASALLLPPGNSVGLTLHYQQPNYWVMPYSAQVAKAGDGTLSNQAGGVPSQVQASQQGLANQYYVPSQISALPGSTTVTTTANGASPLGGTDSLLLVAGVTAAVVLAAASLAVVALRGRK